MNKNIMRRSPRHRGFAIDKENSKCHTSQDPEPSLNCEGGDQSDVLRYGIRDPVQDALLVCHPPARKPNALRKKKSSRVSTNFKALRYLLF